MKTHDGGKEVRYFQPCDFIEWDDAGCKILYPRGDQRLPRKHQEKASKDLSAALKACRKKYPTFRHGSLLAVFVGGALDDGDMDNWSHENAEKLCLCKYGNTNGLCNRNSVKRITDVFGDSWYLPQADVKNIFFDAGSWYGSNWKAKTWDEGYGHTTKYAFHDWRYRSIIGLRGWDSNKDGNVTLQEVMRQLKRRNINIGWLKRQDPCILYKAWYHLSMTYSFLLNITRIHSKTQKKNLSNEDYNNEMRKVILPLTEVQIKKFRRGRIQNSTECSNILKHADRLLYEAIYSPKNIMTL
jgi:hypothetical protein